MPDLVVLGRRLEYRTVQAAYDGAPTILFLHEGLGSAHGWRDFPERLCRATGFAGFAYSRWGYGGSDPRPGPWPVSFLHDEAEHTLPAILHAGRLGRPIVYGHSDGGSIALILAARHPDLVRAVVVEAAHVMVEDVTRRGIERVRARFDAGALRDGLARQHGPNTDTMFQGWAGAWLAPAFDGWDLRPMLNGIHCPVLAIQGSDDEYGTTAQVDAIRQGVGASVETWIIDHAGHAPHRDFPGQVADRVAEFLARHLG